MQLWDQVHLQNDKVLDTTREISDQLKSPTNGVAKPSSGTPGKAKKVPVECSVSSI